jgi:hypothetical protein
VDYAAIVAPEKPRDLVMEAREPEGPHAIPERSTTSCARLYATSFECREPTASSTSPTRMRLGIERRGAATSGRASIRGFWLSSRMILDERRASRRRRRLPTEAASPGEAHRLLGQEAIAELTGGCEDDVRAFA